MIAELFAFRISRPLFTRYLEYCDTAEIAEYESYRSYSLAMTWDLSCQFPDSDHHLQDGWTGVAKHPMDGLRLQFPRTVIFERIQDVVDKLRGWKPMECNMNMVK